MIWTVICGRQCQICGYPRARMAEGVDTWVKNNRFRLERRFGSRVPAIRTNRLRWLWTMKFFRRTTGCIVLVGLSGCISESGPLAVDHNRPFPGLDNLLSSLPAGGSLNIFVTHGMSTKADESEANLRQSIQQRLGLTPVGATTQLNLMSTPPDVWLDGALVWPKDYTGWHCPENDPKHPLQDCDAPYIDISTYTAPAGKQVVFYSLNYWGVLVWLKCSQLVSADTRLTGDLTIFGQGNAQYCNSRFQGRPNFPVPTNAVSSSALILDHVIKNDILDWGFGDAVIAMSGYRAVLHQAVHAALEAEKTDVIARFRVTHPNVQLFTPQQEHVGARILDEATLTQTQAYAIITESLGSYVLLDALAWATLHNLEVDGESIICGAAQIHMLANQISLLRLSRTRVEALPGAKVGEDKPGQGSAPASIVNCPGFPMRPSPYVVGYHDPSDLLTFYVVHPPKNARYSFESQLNTHVINVVAPFAQEDVPFILADPVQAHAGGQEVDERIENMISFGYNGYEANKGVAPDPGPAPSAADWPD
jgi:hypothetical protein